MTRGKIVLTPKKFVIKSYRVGGKSDEDLSVKTNSEMIYEYAEFSEFKTDAKEYKIEN